MATSFDFLPKRARRAAPDRRLPGIFLAFVIFFGLVGLYQHKLLSEVQVQFDKESKEIEDRRQEMIGQARKRLPASEEVAKLSADIETNNYALMGPHTPWYDLLINLEESLPEQAVIAKIENPRTGTPLFNAGETEFRLQVVVNDADTAQAFYKNLSARKVFQSLSFTPKGETIWQGRKGISIEIVFRFGESS
ncbi:MAG: hypothetical protein WA705_07145 [Candidatus Ozemobacteraceae bacterium]